MGPSSEAFSFSLPVSRLSACSDIEPEMTKRGEGHFVACHLLKLRI